MNKKIQLSLLYVYRSSDQNLEKLMLDVAERADIELIILSHLEKTEFPHQKLLKDNVTFQTFPLVSDTFFYNRGFSIAKADLIEIVNDCSTSLSDYDANLSVFNKPEVFLYLLNKNTEPSQNKPLFFSPRYALENYYCFIGCNQFFNKKLLLKNALFFHERGNSTLYTIDLILRAEHFNLKLYQIGSKNKKSNLSIGSVFNMGKDLFHLFNKYQANKRHFLLYSLKNLSSSDFVYPIVSSAGLITAYVEQIIFHYVRIYVNKIVNRLNRICRKYKLTKCGLFPIDLFIEPTNFCNAHCPLCPTGSDQLKRHKGFMSFATFKKIIDESKYFINGVRLWNLGEPFLNPDIYSMIQYAKRFEIFITSSTNGYALYKTSSINMLIESKIDSLVVAADGADKKTFLMYRKGVNYESVISGLKYLRDEKKKLHAIFPVVDLQLILMKQNVDQIDKIKAMAKKLGTQFVIKFLNLEMTKGNDKNKFLPSEKYSTYKIKNNKIVSKVKKLTKNTTCVAWDSMGINWNGSVNPCCFDYYSENILGNTNTQSIREIWNNKRFIGLRKSVLKNRKDIRICSHCNVNEHYEELYYYK